MVSEWQQRLEGVIAPFCSDGAHEIGHVRRVWMNCAKLAEDYPEVDRISLLAMSYLHDIVSYPKDSPDRSRSSIAAADKACTVLRDVGFPEFRLPVVHDGIASHSFSAKRCPRTLEGRILSDGDKLDALGEIGIARLFYTAGKLGSDMFDLVEPVPSERSRDELKYVLDHFFEKLVVLPGMMYTEAGGREAQGRLQTMERFIVQMLAASGFDCEVEIRGCAENRIAAWNAAHFN